MGGESGRRLRAPKRVACCLLLCGVALGTTAQRIRSEAGLVYRNAEEAASGLRGALFAQVLLVPDERRRWQAEAGERDLFELAALKTTHARLGADRGRWAALVDVTVLSSPVGVEHAVALEISFRTTEAVGFSIATRLHSVVIDGSSAVVRETIGAGVSLALARHVTVGYALEDFRIAGEPLDGVDAAVFAASGAGVLRGVVQLRVSREGSTNGAAAIVIRAGSRARAIAGYEGATEAITTSFGFHVASLRLSVGGSLHPVLGLSKSIFIAWSAGR